MNVVKRIACLFLIGTLFFNNTVPVCAVSKNAKIKKAYAKALENKTIKYVTKNYVGGSMPLAYSLRDINGDGIKDLVLSLGEEFLYAWTYRNGKVKVLFKKYVSDPMIFYYDGKGTYWSVTEGDSVYYSKLKINKKNKLVRTASYYTNWVIGNKIYAEKMVGNTISKIPISEYNRIANHVGKLKWIKFIPTSKSKLIAKLKE